jgi:superfamily II DNA helicase RecQ
MNETNMPLKDEQRKAIEQLLLGKDVLAVLPTGFGKSRIYQYFTTVKKRETCGQTLTLVISPLKSIVTDQLSELKVLGYAAANLSELSPDELNECCFNILLSSAEEATSVAFQNQLKDATSQLHKRLSCIVVDESHTVETWTGKR